MFARKHASFACLLVLVMLAAGCKSADAIRADNRESLMQLETGMSAEAVLGVMGQKTYRDQYGDRYTNPHRVETLRDREGETYRVLFYYTDVKKRDGAITDDELTPIVLHEDELVGWGWSYLEDTGDTYTIRIR